MVSGLMVGASFPPSLLPITAGPGLVVFLFVMRRQEDDTNPAIPILLHMMAAWGWAFSWVGFHAVPHVSATSMLVLLALIMLATAASTAGFNWAGLPGLATGHLALEGLLTYGPVSMPWVSSGFTVSGTVLAPLVSLFGIAGTSVLLWTSALALVARKGKHRPWTRMVAVAAFMSLFTFLGSHLPGSDVTTPLQDPLNVRIVQPNMTPDTWADVQSSTRVDSLLRLSSGSAVDLTVWPETALPKTPADPLPWRDSGAGYGPRGPLPLPLLSGGILSRSDTAPWNAAILLMPDKVAEVYAKQELVPFAEYVPGSRWISALSALAVDAGGVPGYAPGDHSSYWTVNGWTLAPMICFESVFALLARRHAREGADVLVVLSQTGWWSLPRAAHQHMAYSSLTARSVGLPLIVSSVNGPSGVIGARGKATKTIPQGVQATRTFTVPSVKVATPYSVVGDWPAWVIFGSLILASVRNRRLRRASSDP